MQKIFLIIINCLLFAGLASGQAKDNIEELLKPRQGTPTLVNDFAGILTADQKAALERKLVALDDSTSSQLAVIIINDLGGYDISDLAVKIGRAWGVGGKEFNNGIILLISKDDRKLWIATGYGLEGALPDITAKHIIEEVIVPQFRGNDYYRGVDEGTNAIISAIKGEYSVQREKGSSGGGGKMAIIVILIILWLLFNSGGRGKGGSYMSGRGYRALPGPIFWPGGFGGGGGRSSGGGGGGFGGFGGGSFGGGGAGGSW